MSVGKGSINRVNNIASPQKNANCITVTVSGSNHLAIEKLKSVPEQWFFYDNSYIELKDLKASINKLGVLEPVIARTLEDGSLQLLSGYKRVKAAAELGLTQIRGEVLQEITEEAAKEIFLELHRDKSPINQLNKGKFTVISKINHDLPEYLL